MKYSFAVLRVGVLALSFLLISPQTNASEFRRIELGLEVAHSTPVDIDGDGVWELALTLNDEAAKVGVFSPQAGTWFDGPHHLTVSGREWGVGDYDDDGALEYAYKRADSVLMYDPDVDSVTHLWSVPPDQDGRAIFWGRDSEDAPLVGIIANYQEYTPPIGPYDSPTSRTWSTARVFSLLEGEFVREFAAGASEWHFINGYDQQGEVHLVLDRQETSQSCGTMISTTRWLYKFTVLNRDWSVQREYHHSWLDEIGCRILVVPRLAWVACAPPAGGGRIHLLSNLSYYPLGSGTLYGHDRDETDPQWIAGVSDRSFAGAAAFDLDADGTISWLLPMEDGTGWEIRDLETGAITDTLEGLPAENLHTGPLFSAGVPDLFYFAASSLYVWGLTTDVADDESSRAPIPRSLTLRAYPNPFNASVTLSWDGDANPTGLEILNILGQRLWDSDLTDPTATSVEWNGRDQDDSAVPSGVYFARLISDRDATVTKLVLLK